MCDGAAHAKTSETNTACGLTLHRFRGFRKLSTTGIDGVTCLTCIARVKRYKLVVQ